MIIDLTMLIEDGMAVYEGDPEMSLAEINTLEKDGFRNHILTTNMHVGTHIDGLSHMSVIKDDISDIKLEHLIGPAKLVSDQMIYEDDGTEMLLVDMLTDTLNENFLESILKSQVKLIVIEKDSVDKYPYSIHKRLFEKGIRIVENAIGFNRLRGIKSFMLYVIPLKIKADSALCRVFVKK